MKKMYNSYENWKGWHDQFVFSAEQSKYFLGETNGLAIENASVLEIGYGSGAFLAWAKGRGATIAGVEIIEPLLKSAKEFGVELLPEKFETVSSNYLGRFHTIVAFDVFEHFSLDEIVDRLTAIEEMLKPGGHLILRFPNAQSPFGLAPQNGDPTHKSALSLSVMENIMHDMDFEVVRYAGSYRVFNAGFSRTVLRVARYICHRMISAVFSFTYGRSIPWDPVVVLVLKKDDL